MTIQLHWEETPEEKHARIDKILEENCKRVVICISCGEVISSNQTVENTPHGPYHGSPMTCVEGRNELNIPWDQL